MTETFPNSLSRNELVKGLKRAKIIAIVRLKEQQEVGKVITALVKGGITALEITSNTPGYLEEISIARANYPDILIGAGTIINGDLAKGAVSAGAQFIVTPNTNESVVDISHINNVPVLMGALTPTEVSTAINLGVDIVKLFPSGELGIPYYKSLKGPFDNVCICPVGGVNLNNISSWFKAGAECVGIGSDLVKLTKNDSLDLIKRAKDYLSEVAKLN